MDARIARNSNSSKSRPLTGTASPSRQGFTSGLPVGPSYRARQRLLRHGQRGFTKLRRYSCNEGTLLSPIPNGMLVKVTMMRCGDYDTVHAEAQWNESGVESSRSQFINAVRGP